MELSRPDSSRSHSRTAAALLLAQFALMWTTVGVLGAAVDWPASLGDPAAVALPRLAAHRGAVAAGYTAYLVSALVLIPVSVLLARTLSGPHVRSVAATLVVALGSLAAFAKALGIGRWLLVMPGLAEAYLAGDAGTRTTVGVVYGALNAYAGGVGEVLGVSLFSGAWTLAVAALLWRVPQPGARRLAGAGAGSALVLLALLPGAYGVDVGPLLTLSGAAWQLWLAALAVWLVRRT